MSPCHVEDHIVPLPVLDEVLAGVVHHSVRADRSDQVDVSRAADARHIRSKRLGDLHGEGAHASRRAVDQDLLPRPNLALVSETLQGGLSGHGPGPASHTRSGRSRSWDLAPGRSHVRGVLSLTPGPPRLSRTRVVRGMIESKLHRLAEPAEPEGRK